MRRTGACEFTGPDMKRLIPALLLLVACHAHADFAQYHEDDEMVSYLDASTIARAGSEARMWTIDDYRKPQNDLEGRKPFLSVKSQWIFDCTKRLGDVLIAFYHAEPMAKGEEVHSGAADKRSWDRVEPGSVGELAFKAACAGPAAARRPAEKPRGP